MVGRGVWREEMMRGGGGGGEKCGEGVVRKGVERVWWESGVEKGCYERDIEMLYTLC